VGTEAGGDNRNIPILDFGLGVADLVAVRTQISGTAIIGAVGVFHLHRLFTPREGKIILRVSRVNVMASSAIKRGDIRHTFNGLIVRGQTGIDTRLSAFGAVTASAGGGLASNEGFPCSMHRILPELRFLGPDQRGVIVAFGAGQLRRSGRYTG
jgi:hypothetical protein